MNALEYRDAMIASYRESFKRSNTRATEQEIEQLVIADLHLVDAARRAGELDRSASASAPRPAVARERPDPVIAAQHETRTQLTVTDGDAPVHDRFLALHGNPLLVSERWGAAVARVQQILERTARAPNLAAAIAGAEFPKLAQEFSQAWSFFMTRMRPAPKGPDHNPFRGLSDGDASRAFMRIVEDICDRSTGTALGPWWVR